MTGNNEEITLEYTFRKRQSKGQGPVGFYKQDVGKELGKIQDNGGRCD